MSDPEKQTASDLKVDFDNPLPLLESAADRKKQRETVEAAIGDALTNTFTKNAEFVTTNEKGQDQLQLRVPFHRKEAPVTILQELDEEGNRTAYLAFEAGWKNYWKYEDGPEKPSHLTPCKKDLETGEFIPMEPRPPGALHDPTSDYEVAFGGRPWVNNLNKGRPELPKKPSRMRKFGRSIIGRSGVNARTSQPETSSDATNLRASETEEVDVPEEQPTPYSPEWANDAKIQKERRNKLEDGLDEILTLTFDLHDDHVSIPQNGIDQLTLRVPYRGRSEALFSCARTVHPDEPERKNQRTVLMALRHATDGDKYWRFDNWDTPDGQHKNQLILMEPVDGGPAIKPKLHSPGSVYDPTGDYEVSNEIEQYLLNNFKDGTPVKPNKSDRKPKKK